ncbi:MAG: hypothetical protein RQ826_01030, partial [Xanthomonadales bacterium]|nr:hypothetical protein [Xanthomonadales bacterium]
AQMRALLQRLGLDWDPRCLSPQDSANLVSTASATQLRDGLSAVPLGSARDYTEFLQPLRDALGAADSTKNPDQSEGGQENRG